METIKRDFKVYKSILVRFETAQINRGKVDDSIDKIHGINKEVLGTLKALEKAKAI
jgi:hypothetical protein